jgi:uncharacterized OsmC-like protein
MTKISSSYSGDLRILSEHIQSGEKIKTDAPLDNNGKGAFFSPTDLLATAYLNCMITIIGIYCDQHNLALNRCIGEVEKIMISNPRRIGELKILLDLTGHNWNTATRKRIETAAKNCPVAKSVSPEINIDLNFIY